MPILNKSQASRRPVKASSLHYDNETSKANDESDQVVENNMEIYTLIDPEDYDAAGSTHFSNNDTSHPVLAHKKGRTKTTAADVSCEEPGGTPLNPGTNNVGTIDNDVDPDAGYIGSSVDFADDPDAVEGDDPDMPDPEDDDDQFTGEDPDDGVVEGSETELENNMKPYGPIVGNDEGGATHEGNDLDFTIEAGEGDDPDWDPPPPDDDEGDDEDDEDLEPEEVAPEAEDVEDEVEEVASEGDVAMLDIDETPDDQVDDVAFATAGTKLLVIKGSRVIATMTGRMAVATGRNDMYLTDQFQEVAAMQLKAHGIRKGLKSMGFVLAKVNVNKQSVLQAQVKKEVNKTLTASRKVQADNAKAFEQSLAIAAVGINRQMFKNTENALRAHLEGELRRNGVRGGSRMLANAFSQHGPAYAKQVIELAKKIAAMPEQVRDGYVEALDMDSGAFDEPDEDMVPVGANEDQMGDEDLEDSDFGETIEASLARPAHRLSASTKISAAASGKYSLAANEVLNGSRPLF